MAAADYQIPRFGSEAEQAALKAARDDKRKSAQDALELDDDGEADAKPKFPTDNELAETTAVMSILAATSAHSPLPTLLATSRKA